MSFEEILFWLTTYQENLLFISKRHLHLSMKEFYQEDLEVLTMLANKYLDENNYREIQNLQMQGIDPNKIPYYKSIMDRTKEKVNKIKKHEIISAVEKKEYINTFTNVLSEIKKNG